MPAEQPYVQGRETDEKVIVAEMIRNRDSEHWKACFEFVKERVYVKTARMRNLTGEDQHEIVQDVMYKVVKYLPNFRFESKLKTWLYVIIGSCINEKLRMQRRLGLYQEVRLYIHFAEHLDDGNNTGDEIKAVEVTYVEEEFETREKIRKGWQAVLEYVRIHPKPGRNLIIVQMVIRDGHAHVEAAKRAGCSEGVVHYIVSEAQKYAREKAG